MAGEPEQSLQGNLLTDWDGARRQDEGSMDAPGSRDCRERFSSAITAPSAALHIAALAARIAESMSMTRKRKGEMALKELEHSCEKTLHHCAARPQQLCRKG